MVLTRYRLVARSGTVFCCCVLSLLSCWLTGFLLQLLRVIVVSIVDFASSGIRRRRNERSNTEHFYDGSQPSLHDTRYIEHGGQLTLLCTSAAHFLLADFLYCSLTRLLMDSWCCFVSMYYGHAGVCESPVRRPACARACPSACVPPRVPVSGYVMLLQQWYT